MCVQMLENPNEVIIHGYAYQDWIREISNPQVGSLRFKIGLASIGSQQAITLPHSPAEVSCRT